MNKLDIAAKPSEEVWGMRRPESDSAEVFEGANVTPPAEETGPMLIPWKKASNEMLDKLIPT